MKIGYFSPFNPQKSGVSDFSEELLLTLKNDLNIDIFSDVTPSNKDIQQSFSCLKTEEIYRMGTAEKYDLLVYHIGNNSDYHRNIIEASLQFPGIVEIHDFSLHNFLAAVTFVHNDIDNYIKTIRYCHGQKGVDIVQKFLDGKTRAPWETHALELTANKYLIDNARGVIVHSDMAKQMVSAIRPNIPVINIPLHTEDIIEDFQAFQQAARDKLNIPPNIIVFGSFGYATRAKRILEILQALAQYKNETQKEFLYLIVGKVDGIDVDSMVTSLGLQKNVRVIGFVDIEEFKLYMAVCNICLNLRYPTHGESSASLHRMLGFGKPVIVSQIGTFEEYPDSIVRKVRYDENEISDIVVVLKELTKSPKDMKQRGLEAVQYAKIHCDKVSNCKKYVEFFSQVIARTWQDEWIDTLVGRLVETGMTSELIVHEIVQKYI